MSDDLITRLRATEGKGIDAYGGAARWPRWVR